MVQQRWKAMVEAIEEVEEEKHLMSYDIIVVSLLSEPRESLANSGFAGDTTLSRRQAPGRRQHPRAEGPPERRSARSDRMLEQTLPWQIARTGSGRYGGGQAVTDSSRLGRVDDSLMASIKRQYRYPLPFSQFPTLLPHSAQQTIAMYDTMLDMSTM